MSVPCSTKQWLINWSKMFMIILSFEVWNWLNQHLGWVRLENKRRGSILFPFHGLLSQKISNYLFRYLFISYLYDDEWGFSYLKINHNFTLMLKTIWFSGNIHVVSILAIPPIVTLNKYFLNQECPTLEQKPFHLVISFNVVFFGLS